MSRYEVVQRGAVPYAAIAIAVPMERLASAGPLNGVVFEWPAQPHVAPGGPPVWKYNGGGVAGQLELEVGVATATLATADDQVSVGELPAGRYLETTYHGHPDRFRQATSEPRTPAHAQARAVLN